jgi:hypothetical protein
MGEAVLQDWVTELPLKQQSALLSGLRGTDHAHAPALKHLTRFVRAATQRDADPESSYMRVGNRVPTADIEREMEWAPLHFVAHLLEALTIIQRHHPHHECVGFASWALGWFEDAFHLRYTKGDDAI